MALAIWLTGGWAGAVQAAGGQDALFEEDLLFAEIPSVFSASKYEQKITEAPARVSIVTADEIRRYGYRTLTEILETLPGFQATYDRNYTFVGARGFNVPGDYNTRFLLLIDGHRINENIYDGWVADRGLVVDVDLIQQVEVVRGPASSLYGSSAFFGVINVITRRGRDLQGAEVAAAVHSHNGYEGRASYGERFDNGVEVLLSASGFDSEGHDRLYYAEFDDPATNDGFAEDADDAKNRNFFAKLAYGGFTLTGVYAEYEKAVPTAPWDTVFNDRRTRTWEGHAYMDLRYEDQLKNGANVMARLFYDDYWYEGDWVYDYADPGDPPDLTVFQDNADGDWWGGELLVEHEWFNGHHLALGAEYRKSLHERQKEFDKYDVYLDLDTSGSVWGVFVQDEVHLRDDLILNLGLRHDRYSTVGGTTNPRVALIWTPVKQSTLKLLYGTAFRAPNAYELHYEDGGIAQKAPDSLDPETVRSYEIVLEQRLNREVNLTAAVYRNEIEDLIAITTDPTDGLLVFENRGSATAKGVELELNGHWVNGWKGSISYSYQQAEDDDGGRLVNYPQNMAKLNVIAPLGAAGLAAGVGMQYEDGRKTLGGWETDSRLLTNLTLSSTDWVDGLTLSASVYNLFDESYAVPGFEEHTQDQIEQDGRTFRLKLQYAF
jgi:iron complex outermembrane receptor protein